MTQELFDILNCAGKKTGRLIPRDEAHASGVWHGAFHCLIIYERDGALYALFQKRSDAKKIAPGKFDVSVGGHYSAGEDAGTAGPREIAEELGLNVLMSELIPLGRRVFVYCFTPGVMDYEFQDVFLLPRKVLPGEVTLQKEEVAGLLEMDIRKGIGLFSGQVEQVECELKTKDASRLIRVSSSDFVPCLDNYYLKLLLLSRNYFAGERMLLI